MNFNKISKYIHEQQLIKRSILYIFGLFVLSVGVSLSINANLGASPVSVIPFVISEIFEAYMGMFMTAMLIVFILFEIAILRKKFKWINLFQIIPSFIFGYFVDLTRMILGDFHMTTYPGQVAMLLTGSITLACGLVIYMNAKLLSMPQEGIIEVIASQIPNGTFPKIKVIFDIVLVSIGIIISLSYFGHLHGIREGTLFFAMGTGRIMPIVRKGIDPALRKIGFCFDSFESMI